MPHHIVIVGTGAAGLAAAETLRLFSQPQGPTSSAMGASLQIHSVPGFGSVA
jgi:thioredoxin reductase